MQEEKQKEYIGYGLQLFTDERVKQIKKGHTFEKDLDRNGSLQLVNIARFLLLHINPSVVQKEKQLKTLIELAPNWDREKLKKYINASYKERLVIAGTLISAELDKIEFFNDRLTNSEGDLKTFKIVLQQDDCAPDSSNQFHTEFIKRFGVPLRTFIEGVLPIDLGDTYIYLKDDYKISNEVGYWRVEELEK